MTPKGYKAMRELMASMWPKRASAIRSKKKRIKKKYSWYNEVMSIGRADNGKASQQSNQED